ncbi:MAG: hypothetical protein IJB73_04065, partial [Firmicutes bacterium]|nr:hypothetical protein [Bacillota bacterium]
MTKNFKGRRAFILIMAIMLTITLIPGTAFAGNGQTEQRIHLDQSIGSNHDVIVVSYDNGSFEGSVTGGGTNLTVDMESMVNLFDFYGESSITVNYQNVTSGATGSLTLSHQEGHADGSLSEPDMGLNNLRGSVIPDQPQSGDEPPAGGGDEPPAGGGDEPPAGGGDEPPAGGGDEPPAGGGDEPPAGGGDEPPAGGGDEPPAGGGDEPPAGGGDEPP